MPKKKVVAGGLTPDEEQFVPPAVKRQLEAAQALAEAQEDQGTEHLPDDSQVDVQADSSIEAPTETPPAEEQKPQSGTEDWKHKYQVLKGKYDAEVPELTNRLMALSSTLDSQGALIQELQQKLQEPAAETGKAAEPAQKFDILDEAEFDGYGENILKLVRQLNALIKRQSDPQPKQNAGPDIEARIGRIEQRVIQSAEEEYYSTLDKSLPDWRVLNRDPKFLAWLQQPDPITEIQRMTAIKRAAGMFNARQVIAIFNAYKRDSGIVDKPTPVKKDIKDQVSVVPSTSGPEGDSELEARERKKYATREEFQEAKNRFIKGRLTEAEFNKVANRFQAAIRDKKVK